jgi:hypothetical protein
MKNIFKYTEFLTENKITELIMESKVIFSKKFLNLLNRMRTNKIASDLLNIYSKDFNIQHNYIDITDNKEEVSFTPDRKVQELIGGRPEVYQVNTRRQLTHSNANKKVFGILGYDDTKEYWQPDAGQRGLIKSETVGERTGKVFVLFEELSNEEDDEKRYAVLNKDCLSLSDYDDSGIWTTARNPIRIGRLVRPLLRSAGIAVVDRDIEEFTNQWKATYDFAADTLKQFDIVKGSSIAYWYDNNDEDKYADGGGTLNNSCMSGVEDFYFEIYTSNSQVSLVILYDDEGQLQDGKYTSSKIKGRAILWDAEINGNNVKFMDRIYTTHDSDVELFKQFAQKNGWFYKDIQSMTPLEYITDGNTRSRYEIVVKVDNADCDSYPYVDTMCFCFTDSNELRNKQDEGDDSMRVLRSTEGEWFEDY